MFIRNILKDFFSPKSKNEYSVVRPMSQRVSFEFSCSAEKNNNKPEDFVIDNGILKEYVGNNQVVYIPLSVKHIGCRAFDNKNIKELHYTQNLKRIGDYAFENCKELIELRGCGWLPDGCNEGVVYCPLPTVSEGTFEGCNKLKEKWRAHGCCEFCGDLLDRRGIIKRNFNNISNVCSHCGKENDYIKDYIEKQKKELKEKWRAHGYCEFCGYLLDRRDINERNFNDISNVCSHCGKENAYIKDYIEEQKKELKEKWRAYGRCEFCGDLLDRRGINKRNFNDISNVCSHCGKENDYIKDYIEEQKKTE